MNALARTSDFIPDVDESTYRSPNIYTTNRQLPIVENELITLTASNSVTTESCATALPTSRTTAYDETTKPAKITLPHLLPHSSFTFPRSFHLLQQWEGRVEQRDSDTFVAVITDKSNVGNPDEEVELFLAEIEREELSFVRPGALFYWSVGYEDGPGIPRQRVSRIRFRRLPGITTRDILRAENNAKKLADLFA